MSVASMCVGDTVDLKEETETVGAAFGSSFSYAVVSADLECRVSGPSPSALLKYQARGEVFTHRVYFSSDIGIQGEASNYALVWKKTLGNKVDVTPNRFLRVVSYTRQNSPSGDLSVWIANCNEETTRKDT